MLLEFCGNGSLVDLLYKKKGGAYERREPLPDARVLEIIEMVVAAVAEMHARAPPITHRDLKLENVLGTADGQYVLCDFGSAVTSVLPAERTRKQVVEEEERVHKYSTMMYRAPEMVDLYRGQAVGPKVDVWACGCILYALCFIDHPFAEESSLQILNAAYAFPSPCHRPPPLQRLIRAMLHPDPATRPAAKDILAAVRKLRAAGAGASSAGASPRTAMGVGEPPSTPSPSQPPQPSHPRTAYADTPSPAFAAAFDGAFEAMRPRTSDGAVPAAPPPAAAAAASAACAGAGADAAAAADGWAADFGSPDAHAPSAPPPPAVPSATALASWAPRLEVCAASATHVRVNLCFERHAAPAATPVAPSGIPPAGPPPTAATRTHGAYSWDAAFEGTAVPPPADAPPPPPLPPLLPLPPLPPPPPPPAAAVDRRGSAPGGSAHDDDEFGEFSGGCTASAPDGLTNLTDEPPSSISASISASAAADEPAAHAQAGTQARSQARSPSFSCFLGAPAAPDVSDEAREGPLPPSRTACRVDDDDFGDFSGATPSPPAPPAPLDAPPPAAASSEPDSAGEGMGMAQEESGHSPFAMGMD